MKQQEIEKIISERLGIAKLNEMQVAIAAQSDAPLMALIAPTGSGKTLAFCTALLKDLQPPKNQLQAVVIAPSRELTLQIYDVLKPIAAGYKTVAFYGGHNMRDEAASLAVMPDIIVATPGRLVDHIQRGNLPKGIKLNALVLDEYDKSLELGFEGEMKKLIAAFPDPRHLILTSATWLDEWPAFMPTGEIVTLDYSADAKSPRSRTRIVHIESPSRDKLDTLIDLIYDIYDPQKRAIIFVNHRESAERVHEHLKKLKMPVGLYHGGLEQIDREKAIELLNNGTTPLLVSTDLASRGLDIADVDSVVHYHLPPSPQSWVHRNGRTARQDASGTVYVITSEGENLPEYVEWDNDYFPPSSADAPRKLLADTATLYFSAGRKEKISRGDIVGFLIANAPITAPEIGRIALKDHSALVAVPASKAGEILKAIADKKIKNKKVKISRVNY